MDMKNSYLFTSEPVSEGHPDKVADQISDVLLDAIIKQDKRARLQLMKLNAQLTELTEEQATYIGVAKQEPYKADQYRY